MDVFWSLDTFSKKEKKITRKKKKEKVDHLFFDQTDYSSPKRKFRFTRLFFHSNVHKKPTTYIRYVAMLRMCLCLNSEVHSHIRMA